jgi:hypothetical protein
MVHRQSANLAPEQAAMAPPTAPQRPLQGNVGTIEQPAVQWFMIPKWLAGKWNKRGDTTLSVTDLRTGRTGRSGVFTEDNMTISWGQQVDKEGNIWHANFIPSERDGATEEESVRFVLLSQSAEVNSEEQFVTRTRYVVTMRYEGTGEVAEKYQQETLADLTPDDANHFTAKSSNKMFYMSGQAYRMGMLSSTFTRVGEFAPRKVERNIDLRRALADYLHAHNMDQLIPTPETQP